MAGLHCRAGYMFMPHLQLTVQTFLASYLPHNLHIGFSLQISIEGLERGFWKASCAACVCNVLPK